VLRRSPVALALIAFVASGCGGDEGEPDLPAQVAALCEAAREDIEALGLPSETGIAVLVPWTSRGARLAKDVAAVEGGTAGERETLNELSLALEEYYAGLRLGYTVYRQTRSSEAYAQAVERAKAFQEDADAAATRLGAPECTRRPFDEAEAP
jgi:hypothetical protein